MDNPLVKLSLGLYILYTQWKLPGKIPDGQLWPNACALKMTCADKYGLISTKWLNSNFDILFVEIFIWSKIMLFENDFIIHFYESIVFHRYFAVKRKKISERHIKIPMSGVQRSKRLFLARSYIKRCYIFNMHVVNRLHYEVKE